VNEARVRATLRLIAIAAVVVVLCCGSLAVPFWLRVWSRGHMPRRYATYVEDYGDYRDLEVVGFGALLLGLVLFAASRRLARAVTDTR
jgi:hypothetical protein